MRPFEDSCVEVDQSVADYVLGFIDRNGLDSIGRLALAIDGDSVPDWETLGRAITGHGSALVDRRRPARHRVLVALSAFFSSSETAIFTLSDGWFAESGGPDDRRAVALQELRSDLHRLLVTILVGNNVVNDAITNVVSRAIGGDAGLEQPYLTD